MHYMSYLMDPGSLASQLAALPPETFGSRSKPVEHIKWDLMDYGPFFSSSFGGRNNPVEKGVSIRIGETNEAAVCFDTELLRMRMGWTGKFLRLSRLRDGLGGEPNPAGPVAFQTLHYPGWSTNRKFTDPRLQSYGALPKSVGRYRGLFTHGNRTILSYAIGGSSVLESPWFIRSNGFPIFQRTFQIEAKDPLTLQVCNVANAKTMFVEGLPVLIDDNPTNATFTIAKVIGAPKGFDWELDSKHGIRLRLPAMTGSQNFSIFICTGAKSNLSTAMSSLPDIAENKDLERLCHGGPSLWKEPVVTHGKLGTQKGAYQVDLLTLPDENPWRSWLRPGGFDFFPDGRIALCSLAGDVWIASGVDAKLEQLVWRRFATGLFQPLGLKIIGNDIYVMCRDAIVRLHDLNGDGEADFYESFNSDISNARNYHEFCLDLQTDTQGNFYTLKGSNLGTSVTQQQGTLLKILSDGSKAEVLATGFRAPNGLCLNPGNELFNTDNEGEWIPACKINHVEKDKFYGHVSTSHGQQTTTFQPPICWLPHVADNSSGAPIWVNSERWGPFGNSLLHTSYGTCSLFAVLTETVNGTWQGGVVRFRLTFDSGIMRGRFNPTDGQLYLCGLAGWQNSATKDGGFYRVRFTGKPVNLPSALHIHADAIEIGFTDPLDVATASDPQNFSAEQWDYKWSHDYGSSEYSPKAPKVLGRDSVEIKAVKLSADHKSVFLTVLPKLKPVMQMKIEYNINAADGSSLHQEIYNTINAVPTGEAAKN
ncbi:MAG: Cytochrome c [Verrucomicrobiales bacterium]|nr:Cytochrome c [Verrucomicrobiales bacterium]